MVGNTDCFNLIYALKDVKEVDLILDEDDKYCIKHFYKLVDKWVTSKGFIEAVKIYQIETMELDMYLVCDSLTTEIIKVYGK
jgi:hypothetical protein